MSRALAIVFLGSLTFGACARPDEAAPSGDRTAPAVVPAPAFEFRTNVGVANVHRGCLAMVEASLAVGAKLTLVGLPGDVSLPSGASNLGEAVVVEKVLADCDTWHLDSFDVPSNVVRTAPAYYRIETAAPWPGSLYAFAIVGPAGPVTVAGTSVRGDLDGDGAAETFHYCTSGEGLHLQIWTGEPLNGRPRWHWYIYLGYDTQPDCTDYDYFGVK